jgi:DNA-binding NarL/FixJ family response regulator
MRTVVVIADDAAVATSNRFALRHAAACRVVATVDGRKSARAQLSRQQPDLVLVNDMCQRTNVVARIREAREEAPNARVVVLADHVDARASDDAFAAGAHAVISRALHPLTLGMVLRELTEGNIAFASRRLGQPVDEPSVAHLHPVRDHGTPVARTSP